jgi:hypothetical protein
MRLICRHCRPASNPAEFKTFVGVNHSFITDQVQTSGQVRYIILAACCVPDAVIQMGCRHAEYRCMWQVSVYPYTTLFGRSGIFMAAQPPASLPSLLSDALATEEGQKYHTSVNKDALNPKLGEWMPSICSAASVNCSAQILHIAPKGYDTNLVEQLVEDLKVPVKVVYLGPEAHTNAIWEAHTKGLGDLFYSYSPNSNQHEISVSVTTQHGQMCVCLCVRARARDMKSLTSSPPTDAAFPLPSSGSGLSLLLSSFLFLLRRGR